MFSFYTRGMNFIDIAYLTPQNIEGSLLKYERQKTGKKFSLGLVKPALQIIEKYRSGNRYLFPLVFTRHTTETTLYNRIKKMRAKVNRDLKKVGEEAGLKGITFYTARHTFATNAKRGGENTNVIQELLGHSNVRTTEIYLLSFGDEFLDEVTEKHTEL